MSENFAPPPQLNPLGDEAVGLGEPSRRFFISFRAVCVALGLLLIASAFLKVHQLLVEPLAARHSFPSPHWRAAWIVLEAAFGLWLVGGAFPAAARYLAAGLFAVLGGFSWVMFFRGETACGCFGEFVEVNPAVMGVLDFAAVVALFLARPAPEPARRQTATIMTLGQKALYAVGVLLAFGVCVSAAVALPNLAGSFADARATVFDRGKWIGRHFPLLREVKVDADVSRGEWVILLVRPGCRDCEKALAELAETEAVNPQVAVIDVASTDQQPLALPAGWRQGTLGNPRSWFVETPTLVRIKEGEVVSSQTYEVSLEGIAKLD